MSAAAELEAPPAAEPETLPAAAVEPEPPADLLETLRALPPEGQRAVVSFARFLRQQEDERRVAADEAEWDRHFNDPAKMARFAEWAEQSLAQPDDPRDFHSSL